MFIISDIWKTIVDSFSCSLAFSFHSLLFYSSKITQWILQISMTTLMYQFSRSHMSFLPRSWFSLSCFVYRWFPCSRITSLKSALCILLSEPRVFIWCTLLFESVRLYYSLSILSWIFILKWYIHICVLSSVTLMDFHY